MSLLIIEENIIGLYALNQWFKVIKGSLEIDAFAVYLEREARRELIFSMGVFYPEIDSQSCTSVSAFPGNEATDDDKLLDKEPPMAPAFADPEGETAE